MQAKLRQPPPPRRVPSPRRAASRKESGLVQTSGIFTPNFQFHYAAVAADAEKLQGHRDDIRNVKISLLSCDDTFNVMKSREAQWKKITNNEGPGAIAMGALSFAAKSLAAMDETERTQDRVHAAMPEMSTVLLEKERAQQDAALQRQTAQIHQHQQQQKWGQTAEYTNAALKNGNSVLSQPPTRAMVNPYTVVPSQCAMQAFFGNNNNNNNRPPLNGSVPPMQVRPSPASSNPPPPNYSYGLYPSPPLPPQQQQPPQLQQPQQMQQQRPPSYTYAMSVSYPVNTTMYGNAQQPGYRPYGQNNTPGAMYQAL